MLCLELEVRMARRETKICVHKFASTNVTPPPPPRPKKKKKKNGGQILTHAALCMRNKTLLLFLCNNARKTFTVVEMYV